MDGHAPLLEVSDVVKRYAGSPTPALSEVSLQVRPGEVYGLLGPNGAGKSTLIRIINHIVAPDSGRVLFDGAPLTRSTVSSQIGYLPEERGLYKKMRVGDQALYFARLRGLSTRQAREAVGYWFSRMGIAGWLDKKVDTLSKGMAQKVQFIITVLHRPRLLILDEPFSGFDPVNAQAIRQELLELQRQGTTIILSTHDMESVEQLCSYVTLINRGRDILSGRVADIRANYSQGRYTIAYEGSSEALGAALGPVAEVTAAHPRSGEATLVLRPGATTRELLARANEAVEIRSFGPALPSMRSIFINLCAPAEGGADDTPQP